MGLRHTSATTVPEGGANVVEVQQLLGHASLDTTKRYLEATAKELRDSLKAHPATSPSNATSPPNADNPRPLAWHAEPWRAATRAVMSSNGP